METKLNYEVIKILLAEVVLSFLPDKAISEYLSSHYSKKIRVHGTEDFRQRSTELCYLLGGRSTWSVSLVLHFNICDCLERFFTAPDRDGSLKASDLVETLT